MRLQAVFLALAILPGMAFADINLVVNGGFETGDFTGTSPGQGINS